MQDDTWLRNWQAAHEKKERAKMTTGDDFRIEHRYSERYMRTMKRFNIVIPNQERMIELLAEENEQLEQQLREARALLEEYTGLIVETMNNPAPESSMALYHKVCVFLDKEA